MLIRIYPNSAYHNIFELQYHHYIRQQWIRNHKEEFKKVEHLQKLFLIPTEMHNDIHSRHSKFFQKWGYDLKEFIYDS